MKLLKIYSALFLYILLGLASAISSHSQTKISAALPESRLGEIVGELINLVNGPDEPDFRKFVEERFTKAAIKNEGEENIVKQLQNLRKQSGGIEIVSVTPPAGEHPMYMVIKSRNGDRFARVVVGISKTEDRLLGIGITKTENPNANDWPAGKFSEAEMVAEIERFVARRTERGDFAGVVLVAKGDKILLHKPYGYADRESKTPITTSTQFHLASVGKMFTSAAIALLVKEGKISYNDKVGKLIPDFPNREIAEKVTVHQLLTHSAGLGTFFESPGFQRGRVYKNATEEISVYKDEPLFFEPGAKWRYSNAGYSLLGAIIERVSGKSYVEFVRERIFEPLGIKDTYSNPPGTPAKNGAVLYTPSDLDPFGLEAYRSDRGILNSQGNGFGGGLASAGDLFRFLRIYRNGKLLGKELITNIVTPKVEELNIRNWGYGIVESNVNGEIIRGHSGGGRVDVKMLWKSGYTVIVMTNATPPTAAGLSGKIVDFITKQTGQ